MTLTTRILVVEPTPVREVFDACRRLLGALDSRFVHDAPARFDSRGVARYSNLPFQGYAALLWVSYGVDGPIKEDPDYNRPNLDGWSIEVSFDTPYGYEGRNGASCSDLHAWLVRELGSWLSERGLTWYWCDDFTGEWYTSIDPVTALGDPDRGALDFRPVPDGKL